MIYRDLRQPFKSWLFTTARLCSAEGEPAADEAGAGTEPEAPEVEEPQVEEAEVEASAEGDEEQPPADDTVEIDHDGQKYKVPKALKEAFLRQADYTQKSQTLADQRREFDQQANARVQEINQRAAQVAQVDEAAQAISKERVEVAKAADTLTEYKAAIATAWQNARQANAQGDLNAAAQYQLQAQELRNAADQWQDHHDSLKVKLTEQEQALAQERQQLSKQLEDSRSAAIGKNAQVLGLDQAKFERLATGLGQHGIPGQLVLNALSESPETIGFALQAFGWKEELDKLKTEQAARKGAPPASARPAAKVGGTANATKNPDRMTTDEWMVYERERVAKEGARQANGRWGKL